MEIRIRPFIRRDLIFVSFIRISSIFAKPIFRKLAFSETLVPFLRERPVAKRAYCAKDFPFAKTRPVFKTPLNLKTLYFLNRLNSSTSQRMGAMGRPIVSRPFVACGGKREIPNFDGKLAYYHLAESNKFSHEAPRTDRGIHRWLWRKQICNSGADGPQN